MKMSGKAMTMTNFYRYSSIVFAADVYNYCNSNPYEVTWAFSDGSSGSGAILSKAFTTLGPYTATATAVDSINGISVSESINFTIVEEFTDTWSYVGDLIPDTLACPLTMTLDDNTILLVGGYGNTWNKKSYVFDGTSYTEVGDTVFGVANNGSCRPVKLPNGKVMIIGCCWWADNSQYAPVQIYDPVAQTWSAPTQLQIPNPPSTPLTYALESHVMPVLDADNNQVIQWGGLAYIWRQTRETFINATTYTYLSNDLTAEGQMLRGLSANNAIVNDVFFINGTVYVPCFGDGGRVNGIFASDTLYAYTGTLDFISYLFTHKCAVVDDRYIYIIGARRTDNHVGLLKFDTVTHTYTDIKSYYNYGAGWPKSGEFAVSTDNKFLHFFNTQLSTGDYGSIIYDIEHDTWSHKAYQAPAPGEYLPYAPPDGRCGYGFINGRLYVFGFKTGQPTRAQRYNGDLCLVGHNV